jgi:tRNA pseudouridine55 synthase
MYSALKVNGQKLCDLARAGKEVERKARSVEIYEICILDMDLPRVRMSVSCSKGTYIRTLCHDIGEKLGCCGCMEKLTRTKVGQFLLKDSLTLAQVEELRDTDRLSEAILPVDGVFHTYPAVILKQEAARLGYNGNPFSVNDLEGQEAPKGQIRVYDPEGSFIGIYHWQQDRRQYRPVKMFYEK